MTKRKLTVFQKLNTIFGPTGTQSPRTQTNRYSIGNDAILKTTDKAEFETAKLQAQQNKYVGGMWRSVDNEMFQKTIHYETTRIGSYSDFESMEFYPEISATLDIFMEECLGGESIIPLLNGKDVTIESLYNEQVTDFWVYAVDIETDTIKPAKVDKVVLKGVKDTYKITLDDGSELISTDNHKWLTNDNTWLRTDELVFGSSLKSISTRLDYKGYQKVSLTNFNGGSKLTHIMVAENTIINEKEGLLLTDRSDTEKIVVHHKSFDKLNNDPSELTYMLWDDHQKLHTDLNTERWNDPVFADKMRKVFSDTGRNTWENGDQGSIVRRLHEGLKRKVSEVGREEFYKHNVGDRNPMYGVSRFGVKNPNYNNSVNHIVDIIEEDYINFIVNSKGNRRELAMVKFNLNKGTVIDYNKYLCHKFNLNRIEELDYLFNEGFNIVNVKKFISENSNIKGSVKKYCKRYDINNFKLTSFLKTKGYKNWSDVHSTIGNHRVISVEYLGREKVYDLVNSSVDHNFAVKCNDGMVISHNCTTTNDKGRVLNIFSNSKRVKTILEDLFFNRLDIHTTLPMWTRNTCKYGDNFVFLNIDDSAGIIGARQLPNFEIERREGDVFGRIMNTNKAENEDEPKVKFIWRGKDIVFNSWQIAHFRLLGDDRRLPYGTSVLEKARRIWKQLILSEDAMLIYRVTRAPERRVYKIYVGNIDDEDVPSYVDEIANRFKRTPITDPKTGQVDLQYNQMANDQDFFIPVRSEDAPNPIDTLPGACISLDTRIPLLDGRTLELNEIISEWDKGNRNLWVYSCDPNTGAVAPGMITWAGETRKNAEVLKITLDNGESITTTPDHKWVHRTNGFVEAQDLVVGDSLMPFYSDTKKIKSNTSDYHRVWDTSLGEWVFTHRMVTDFLDNFNVIESHTHDNKYSDSVKNIRHHKDYGRFNNNPDNLVWMNGADHMKYHQSVIMETIWSNPEENIKKIRKGVNRFISNQTDEERLVRGEQSKLNSIIYRDKANDTFENNPNKLDIIKLRGEAISKVKSTDEFKERFSEIAKTNWESDEYRNKVFSKRQTITFTDKLYHMYFEMFKLYGKADLTLIELNKTEDFMLEFITSNENIRSSMTNLDEFTRNHLGKMLKERGFENYRDWCKVTAEELGYKNVRAWRYSINKNKLEDIEVNYNHKIVSIEWLVDVIDTGTITVDGDEIYHNYHTFATESGVFIKNSNLDQIADIEYLQKKLFTALRVPKSFLGYEEAMGDGKNLALQDIRFTRTVNRIQQSMIMELNKIAVLHLFLLGLEDELDNFTLTLNNPSTQAQMMKIEQMQAKVTLFKDATVDIGNGFAVMSMTKGKRDILEWSDDEIKQDLLEQRLEKAAAAEMENTANVIKHTGTFDEVDRLYGDIDIAMGNTDGATDGGEEGEEGGDDFGGGGGGGGGGFGGGGVDFGEEGDDADVDVDAEGDDTATEDDGGLDFGDEGGEPTEESIKRGNKLITEQRKKYNKKVKKYQNNYFGKLLDSVKKSEDVILNERVKVTDKNVRINESIGNMIDDIDKMLNE